MCFCWKFLDDRENISLTEQDLEYVANHFRQHMNESELITLDSFKKMMTSKDVRKKNYHFPSKIRTKYSLK